MPIRDTLFIGDSTSYRYIDFEYYEVKNDSLFPINKIWHSSTQIIYPKGVQTTAKQKTDEDTISVLVFVFFLILVVFTRELTMLIRPILSSFFSYKENIKLDERKGLTLQRNIIALLGVLFLPISILIIFGARISKYFNITVFEFYGYVTSGLLTIWIIRKLIFKYTSWLSSEKTAFKTIEKISYNYFLNYTFILFVVLFIFSFLGILNTNFSLGFLKLITLFVYIVYNYRAYQVLKNHHFSFIFYILYLCAVEILPISLFTKLILLL